jgi:hypothetical protein
MTLLNLVSEFPDKFSIDLNSKASGRRIVWYAIIRSIIGKGIRHIINVSIAVNVKVYVSIK